MATVLKNLFRSRAESYFDSNYLPSVFFRIFGRLYENTVCSTTSNCCLKLRFPCALMVESRTVKRKVCENQNEVWSDFCLKHTDLKQAYDCLNNVPPYHFLSLANTQILSVGSMFKSGSWGISVLMSVFPGSLILKMQLALFANKVWKLLITSFSSVLGSKKTLTPFGTS